MNRGRKKAVNKRQLRHEPDARWTLLNHFHVSTSPAPPTAQRQFRLAIPPAALKESSVWGDQRAGLVPSELNTEAGTLGLLTAIS